ncbi:MAG: Basic proline-rich protein precursor [Candidatus Ozemobacter sibiricus]|uniref:Basic proline-rich protein n=1 Tax=Candidatus Ozemobacter sibiricus TaxID=2268124 RepID=A0A367ZLK8_9BACT|nr:MAG: Basic proline-rich protein precursor [Candidatus Ozemobacter sibiricus]
MSLSAFIPQELESPIRSARLLALQNAFFEGQSEEELTALEQREPREEDEECRRLLRQAIQAVRRRLGKIDAEPSPAFDPAAFHQRYQAADAAARLRLLEDLDSLQRSALASRALDWFIHASEPALQATLIRMFGEFWPAARLELLAPRLHDHSLSVRMAALGVLSKRAPRLIADDLAALAEADDPGRRALAIRGLFGLEPSRALTALSGMLLSPDPAQRRTALHVGLALPFEQVKPLLLQFIAVESDPELLWHAGRSFQLHPDVDSPYRLWEIAEESPPAKAAMVRRILHSVCEAISTSNLLGEERKFHEYYQQLQEWIYRKAANRFVQDCIARLAQEEDGGEPPELAAAVRKHIRSAPVRAAFEEALTWPLAEPVRHRLERWLQETAATEPAATAPDSSSPPSARPDSPPPPPATLAPPATRPAPPSPAAASPADPTPGPQDRSPPDSQGPTSRGQEVSPGLSEDKPAARAEPPPPATTSSAPASDRGPAVPAARPPPSPEEALFAQAASWDRQDLPQARPILQKALADPSLSDRARILLLRTALRLGARDFISTARGWLKHPNEGVVAAAIDYLAFADPDGLFPLIGQFFRNPAQRVVSAAIKALRQVDQAQAVSYLTAMLRDRQPSVQKVALGCLVFVDFALIRQPLAAFMAGTRSRECLEAALCLFLANPEPENLPLLDEVARALPADLQSLLLEVRNKTEAMLARFGRRADPGPASDAGAIAGTPPDRTAPPRATGPKPAPAARPPAVTTGLPKAEPAPRQAPAAPAPAAPLPIARSGPERPRPPHPASPSPGGRPPSPRPAPQHLGSEKNRPPRPSAPGEVPPRWWSTPQTWMAAGGFFLVGAFFYLLSAFLSPLNERPTSPAWSGDPIIRSAPATDNASGPLTTSADLFAEYRRLKRRGKTP